MYENERGTREQRNIGRVNHGAAHVCTAISLRVSVLCRLVRSTLLSGALAAALCMYVCMYVCTDA